MKLKLLSLLIIAIQIALYTNCLQLFLFIGKGLVLFYYGLIYTVYVLVSAVCTICIYLVDKEHVNQKLLYLTIITTLSFYIIFSALISPDIKDALPVVIPESMCAIGLFCQCKKLSMQ